MTAPNIRPFHDEDAPAVSKLHIAAILATSDEFYSQAQRESWAFGKTPEDYFKVIKDGEIFIVAVDEADKPLGFCSYIAGEIKGLYVDPAHQGKGVGHALMTAAETTLTAAGDKSIKIHSGRPALAFYQAHGYEIVEQTTHKTRGGLEIETYELMKLFSN